MLGRHFFGHASVVVSGLTAAALASCIGCEIREQPPAEARGSAEPGDGQAGGGIDFVAGYERGFQAARQQQKPMMIFFTAQWCTYCRQMANEAFLQKAVVSLSRQFVCVLVDADAEPAACREFEVRSFPTIQFVSARGARLNRLIGKQPPRELIAQMQAALETLARRPELTTDRR
ncbi:MAG TPA: thioredoxin family protein [Pirellulales bacterium]|jgi:thiol:disulfide interchange protein|nr:thioredoxin family protein [Pirellulales bacterium]